MGNMSLYVIFIQQNLQFMFPKHFIKQNLVESVLLTSLYCETTRYYKK